MESERAKLLDQVDAGQGLAILPGPQSKDLPDAKGPWQTQEVVGWGWGS